MHSLFLDSFFFSSSFFFSQIFPRFSPLPFELSFGKQRPVKVLMIKFLVDLSRFISASSLSWFVRRVLISQFRL